MAKKKEINTSVDKLMALVDEFGRISFKQASKKLAIPVSTIEEWGNFLSEENVLDIDFKLTSPILIKKEFSKQEQKKQVNDFKKNRLIFDRKIDSATSYFNELDKKISYVSKLFSGMEDVMGSKLKEVNEELLKLTEAEFQKEQLDKKILESKQNSNNRLKEIEENLEKRKLNYEKTFNDSKKELDKDSQILKKESSFLLKVKEEEKKLKKNIEDVKAIEQSIQMRIDSRTKMMEEVESHLSEAQKEHETLREKLEEEHKSLKLLIEENVQKEKEIEKLQNTIFKKMEKSEENLTSKDKEIKNLPNHFKKIISHKKQINDLLNVINHKEIDLKEEILKLKKKAKVLELTLGTNAFEKEMKEINVELDKISFKRKFFKDKIKELIKLFDWS